MIENPATPPDAEDAEIGAEKKAANTWAKSQDPETYYEALMLAKGFRAGAAWQHARRGGEGAAVPLPRALIDGGAYLTGRFVLRNGQESDCYVDKYAIGSNPTLLARVARECAALLPPDTQVIAGPELGAVPLVVAVSLLVGLPCAIVRKQAKDHGADADVYVVGAAVEGKRVTVIEDVVTTGFQASEAIDRLRRAGAVVRDAIAVVDRQQRGGQALKAAKVQFRALCTLDDLRAATAPARSAERTRTAYPVMGQKAKDDRPWRAVIENMGPGKEKLECGHIWIDAGMGKRPGHAKKRRCGPCTARRGEG